MSGRITYEVLLGQVEDPEGKKMVEQSVNLTALDILHNPIFKMLCHNQILLPDEAHDYAAEALDDIVGYVERNGRKPNCSIRFYCKRYAHNKLWALYQKRIISEVVLASSLSDFYKMNNGDISNEYYREKETGEIVKDFLATNVDSESGITGEAYDENTVTMPKELVRDAQETFKISFLHKEEIHDIDKLHCIVMYACEYRGYFEAKRANLDTKVSDCFPFEMVLYECVPREEANSCLGSNSKIDSFNKRLSDFRSCCTEYLASVFDQPIKEVRYGLQTVRELAETYDNRVICN